MTLQILSKRSCPVEVGPSAKRWKSQSSWAIEGVAPVAATSAAAEAAEGSACVKQEDPITLQEPTSVLDLQTSPGRSSSSGSLSSHSSLSGDETSFPSLAGTDICSEDQTSSELLPVSTVESVHNDHDIASWMECMEDPNGPLALTDFSKCEEGGEVRQAEVKLDGGIETGIDHFVNADIDFGFELSLDDSDHEAFANYMLSDPGLCLMDEPKFLNFPEGFQDAHRLLELGDSLSSMIDSAPGIGVGEVQSSDASSTPGSDVSYEPGYSGSQNWESNPLEVQQPLDSGLQLVHLLLACAEAIEESNFDTARPMLSRLKAISNPYGDPMQRISLYFADALSDRLTKESETPVSAAPISSPVELDTDLAYQSFYEVLPFAKFTHFTANQAIFEAVGYHNKIHVVDLDIQQGLQWPSFLQTLALRPGGPPSLKITAVGTNAASLQLTKRRLSEFAQALEVPFELIVLVEDLDNLDKEKFQIEPDEALAVNCSQVLHRLSGSEAVLQKLLLLLRSLNPEVVTLLEVEANHNGANLISRFVEALHYYCALFDALEASVSSDSPDRFRIENITLASEIRGIVALEGSGRGARHVKSETWQSHFTKCGFRNRPLSSYAVQQAQLLLGYFVTGETPTYKLSEEFGVLIMGWQDTPVMAVSSWSC